MRRRARQAGSDPASLTLGLALVTIVATLTLPAPADAQRDSITLSGRVLTTDGGDPGSLQIRYRPKWTLRSTAYAVDADGRFRFTVPVPRLDSARIVIDGMEDTTRRYYPVGVWLDLDAHDREELRVLAVLPPPVWTVERGRYAGRSLRLDLSEATEQVLVSPYSSLTRAYLPRSALWSDRDYPRPAYFDQDFVLHGVPRPIAPEDSAGFWATVDSIEAEYGRDLWYPIPESAAPGHGALRIRIDPSSLPGAAAAVGSPTRLIYRTRVGSGLVTRHELGHVLGFSHTCAWFSMVNGGPCQLLGPYPRAERSEPWKRGEIEVRHHTPITDVAYAELMWAQARVVADARRNHGFHRVLGAYEAGVHAQADPPHFAPGTLSARHGDYLLATDIAVWQLAGLPYREITTEERLGEVGAEMRRIAGQALLWGSIAGAAAVVLLLMQ